MKKKLGLRKAHGTHSKLPLLFRSKRETIKTQQRITFNRARSLARIRASAFGAGGLGFKSQRARYYSEVITQFFYVEKPLWFHVET
jgi:hypothetical protein